MAKLFGEIRQPERLLDVENLTGYIYATEELPDPSSVDLLTCMFLLKYQEIGDDRYAPGSIYIVRLIDDQPTWIDITITERGALAAPSSVWKRLAKDAIILHWLSPNDVVNEDDPFESATWDHDVIVRKRGEAPVSPQDGEVVGYSPIKNQYNENSLGFVHPLDPSYDNDYYYRIFAVTKSGVYTGSDPIKASWTWPEIREEIGKSEDNIGLYKKMFRIGDIFPLPRHSKYGTLYAQLVDCRYSLKREYSGGSAHIYNPESLTFMITNVLGSNSLGCGGMSFDNKELKYTLTNDTVFKTNKKYFVRDPSISVSSVTSEDELFIEYDFIGAGYTAGSHLPITLLESYDGHCKNDIYELNTSIRYFQNNSSIRAREIDVTAQVFNMSGNGSWVESNIRAWLNTDLPSVDALSSAGYSQYPTNDRYGWKLVPPESRWKESSNEIINQDGSKTNVWFSNPRNGWFYAEETNLQNVAPEDPDSAHYVDIPLFIHGFRDTEDGRAFLDCIMTSYISTFTDAYVNRNIKDTNNDNSNVGTVIVKPSLDKFWLPSFAEIYGKNARVGYNGDINTSNFGSNNEGSCFKLFNPSFDEVEIKRSVPYSRDLRIKTDLLGNPCRWYTRSVDQTSPGRVFYVDKTLPEDPRDPMSSIALTCTAHRPAEDDPIGAVVCFTIA